MGLTSRLFGWSGNCRQKANSPDTANIPRPGEVWLLNDDDSPWPREDAVSVKIRDVRQGWVRYDFSHLKDCRMKIKYFVQFYTRKAQEGNPHA